MLSYSRINKDDYISIFLLIFFSGSPTIFSLGKDYVYSSLLILILILYKIKKIEFYKVNVFIMLTFSALILAHLFLFGSLVIFSSIGFLIQLLICYILAEKIKNFPEVYVNIIYFLSILSLVFWGLHNMGVPLMELFSVLKIDLNVELYNIIIHNFFNDNDVNYRNSGVFWEPGAYAGYLNLAFFMLVFNIVKINKHPRKILIIIFAIISTFSTTGYVAASFIIISKFLLRSNMKFISRILIVIALMPILGYVAISLDFIGEKITEQLYSTELEADGYQINRFGNFLYDINWIEKKPIVGWGTAPSTRIVIDNNVEELGQGQGNGLTGFAIKFGLVGFFLYFLMCYRSFKCLGGSKYIGYISIILIALLLNGEQFLNYPIFLMLMFLKSDDKKFKS